MLKEVQEQTEGVRFLRRVIEGHLTSPLLLVGDDGVGRRFSVIEAAREAFSGGDSNSTHSVQIDQGVHPDLVVLHGNGKAIGVSAIREVVEQAYSFPSMVPARYVCIDGADTMTLPAADALLKTLEEPPSTTRFFLLASQSEKVLPTIRSRCGLVRYRPLSEALIVQHLMKVEDDPTKALVYARLSGGSVGRAVQFQLTGRLALRNRVLSLLRAALNRDYLSLFTAVDDLEDDLGLGLRFLETILADLAMISHAPAHVANVDVAEELEGLRRGIGDKLELLTDGLWTILDRDAQTKINLAFHVKTLLATAFGG